MTGEPTERDVEALALTDAEKKRLARADRINFEALCNAVTGILAERIAQARREGAAEVTARVEALADEWEAKPFTDINEHNYAVGAVRTCGATLRTALRGDA